MKIINTITGETVSEITANHSMTLDEAINLVGEIITPENPGDADVLIGGNLYFYDDLAMDWHQEKKLMSDEVFGALCENCSAEYDEAAGGVTYYLHITDDGEIMPTSAGADKTFTYTIKDEAEYFGAPGNYDIGDYYGKESTEDADFMNIVDRLTDAANQYLQALDV